MIYIKSLHIENYKCFENIDINFNKNTNILVGNNEAGKSTILEAINLCLSGLTNGRYLKNEINEFYFNTCVVNRFLHNLNEQPPQILIELYLDSDEANKDLEFIKGTRNTRGDNCPGVKLKISFDERYKEEYELYKQNNGSRNFPIEYYKIDWLNFDNIPITSRSIPLKPNLIDSSCAKYKNGSDYYISRIISNQLDKKEQVALMQAFRNLKNDFRDGEALQTINNKIAQSAKISEKKVSISVNTTVINAWESILNTYLDEIPFTQVGQGEQSIVKTHLALSNIRKDISNVVLIEEPENHLSHTNLNCLLKSIEERNTDRQIILTTHSSFVANKLGLNNLLFLNQRMVTSFSDVDDDTKKYFQKLAGYETLRLILSDKAILVEGPSDELIVQKAYMNEHEGHLPIQDRIDVISVKGVQARRFLALAKNLPIRIAVVTDNDSDYIKNITEKYKDYISETVNVFSNTDDKQYTLEPSFTACNNEQELKKFLCPDYNGGKSILEWMEDNKSEWALKIFSENNNFSFPQYIIDCIEWISK